MKNLSIKAVILVKVTLSKSPSQINLDHSSKSHFRGIVRTDLLEFGLIWV